ncbi:hypothetical protein L0U85_10250 [Glycomyces sp. L485]|uniref:hypothetical protein n=1 Tax=Glycomyces sp. L485 TaxID=2909235 RepID=UPI001F4A239C|nr:hypothetical protein [Glycomyces sp. L485]MCH7231229.1 hypothetical protein [Glycomyces sp. L485]
MVYDQNRPEEPQRPSGDEQPARRRIGRSWGPSEEPAPETDEGVPQGGGQQPEQYRFDPDRGRRHRYSEEPTGQMPGVPVEIAETGPMVPATRRASPGEQFEPIPPATQHQPGQQPESPFAPPPAMNQEHSAPPQGANQDRGVPNPDMGPGQQFSVPQHPSAPVGPVSPPGAPSAPNVTGAIPTAQPTPANHPAPPSEGTEQAPNAAALPVTEVDPQLPSPPARHPTPSVPAGLPSPPPRGPVTEQAPPRTPPASRQPPLEPTPPVTTDDEPGDGESGQLLEWVREVPGVRDAYHVTAPDGSPSLRLELDDGVDPDEVQAAVSAVVAEQRATSPGPQTVDEPGEEAQAELEPAAPAEAELRVVGPVEMRRVEIDSAGLEAEVSVTLAVGDYESAGAVTVPPIDWHVQHAAAAATVEALRPYFGETEARVEVEHASIVTTGPVKTAVVVVLWLDGQSVRRLAGAAVVTAERFKAVVSATLSALAAEVAH